jgi:hypothetical protein
MHLNSHYKLRAPAAASYLSQKDQHLNISEKRR